MAAPVISRIAVLTDLSTESRAAVLEAVTLARAFAADLVVVAALPTDRVGREVAQGQFLDGLLDATRLRLAAWFAAQVPEDLRRGLAPRFVAVVGPPARVLLEVAGAERADLIVLTAQRRSGWARWVRGSVAEEVLRAAPVPVVTVRGGAKAAA